MLPGRPLYKSFVRSIKQVNYVKRLQLKREQLKDREKRISAGEATEGRNRETGKRCFGTEEISSAALKRIRIIPYIARCNYCSIRFQQTFLYIAFSII